MTRGELLAQCSLAKFVPNKKNDRFYKTTDLRILLAYAYDFIGLSNNAESVWVTVGSTQ